MKLKIRYDDTIQTIDLDAEATRQMWVSLSLQGEELTDSEKEQKIQEAFDEQYNRPEYNNWHKETRHIGFSKAKPGKDEDEDDVDSSEPLMNEVADDRIFMKDELERREREDYEDWCDRIRAAMKPDYAEMIIAIHLDGMEPCEYAESIGEKPNTLNHRLQRAEKKFREIFPRTSF